MTHNGRCSRCDEPADADQVGETMFCTNCGSKIEEGAYFCGNCGCRIAGPAANAGHEPSPAQPQNAAYTQQNVQYPLDAPVAPQRSSFASFLTERRQIGRAMVPTFAIILAAMIAAAGAAYALCKAYQVFVAPALEQKSEPAGEDKGESNKETVAAKNKKAHEAYDGIIDVYRQYGEYCDEMGAGSGDEESLKKLDDLMDGHSYIGPYAYDKRVDPECFEAYYMEKDLDGDGVDELLIAQKFCYEEGNREDFGLVNFYYFEDGRVRSIYDNIGDGMATATLSKDGFLIMGEGQGIEVCDGGKIALRTSQDRFSASYYFDYAGGKMNLTDALQLNYDDSSDEEDSYKVMSIENGKKQPDQTIVGWQNAGAMRDEFDARYQASTENSKLLASHDWTKIE